MMHIDPQDIENFNTAHRLVEELKESIERRELTPDAQKSLTRLSETTPHTQKFLREITDSERFTELHRESHSDNRGVERLITRIDQRKKHSQRLRRIGWGGSVAAAVVISVLFLVTRPSEVARQESNLAHAQIPFIVLEDGTKVDLSRKVVELDHCTIHNSKSEGITYQTDQQTEKTSTNTLIIPPYTEEPIVITLADGTRVHMNADSKLEYPTTFVHTTQRRVVLSGEAFFEVTKSEQPFIVVSGKMELRVLGTSFNVKAYDTDNEIVSTLITGRIRQKYNGIQQEYTLTPGEQSVYVKAHERVEVKQVDTQDYLAWLNQRIIVRNRSVEEILNQLAHYYNFSVEYRDNSLKLMKFSLNVKRYPTVKEVLDKLELTDGIRFIYSDTGKITVTK